MPSWSCTNHSDQDRWLGEVANTGGVTRHCTLRLGGEQVNVISEPLMAGIGQSGDESNDRWLGEVANTGGVTRHCTLGLGGEQVNVISEPLIAGIGQSGDESNVSQRPYLLRLEITLR
ncbi:hypothetical protein J6590_030464 [Homalodisca vitripennis]|nr:hypothetical protein J6590_030464 [Homalodisca vitripennis]